MPLAAIPVSIPYRLTDDTESVPVPIQVDAVATEPKAALATAYVLVQGLAKLRHPGRPIQVQADRCQIGRPGAPVTTPYAYILGTSQFIPHVVLPARVEGPSALTLDQTLKGIPDGQLGVIIDCATLGYMNSQGLAGLAAHAARLRLRLFRVPDPIAKVLSVVGLDRIIRCSPTLQAAIEDLAKG